MHEEDSAPAMDCKETASVLDRRLSEPQKLPKRVSFKDETWVIHIPAREESDVNFRERVILTRNAVAGQHSALTNRAVMANGRTSLAETLSRSSLYANRGQRTPQTQVSRTVSSGHATNRGPYKSILKTPTPRFQKDDHLSRSQMPARHVREVSSRHSLDNYFMPDSSHLLPSKDPINRLQKPALTRTLPTRRTVPISHAQGSDDSFLCNKTGRFVSKEFSGSNRTSLEHNFNQYERTRKFNTATQPELNFDIVGVTYGSVSEMPYFYDIRGLVDGINATDEYSFGTKSPHNDRAGLEHSSVSTPLNQFGSRREERYFSAIPAIEAFKRRTRGTRRPYFSSAWTHEQDTSPKRQLPIAWQPAKQYNFSTK
ncbi:hypothetical protein OS493_009277 [Desmophyllum pertusum]|uniref:Uncharacterized protein n=1 Tax=Desmophyllum pertusum TaxID=174260 RepID=A0A9X0CSE2_9CNID|nr:hypothetical protein OS493_009277 [Desmophyllum pertusum]